jgi:predicted nucleotidyltransferase
MIKISVIGDLISAIEWSKYKMPSKTALDIKPSQWRHYRPFKMAAEKRLSPTNLAEATSVARSIAKELIERFGAKKVILFGSLARGGYTRWSDIDLAVWGIPPVDFFKAVSFATGFSKIWKVDLVDGGDCSNGLQDVILGEGIEL